MVFSAPLRLLPVLLLQLWVCFLGYWLWICPVVCPWKSAFFSNHFGAQFVRVYYTSIAGLNDLPVSLIYLGNLGMAVGDMTGLVTKLARMFFVRDFIVATGCFFFGTRAGRARGDIGALVLSRIYLIVSAECSVPPPLTLAARPQQRRACATTTAAGTTRVPGQYLVGAAFPMGKGTALAAELSALRALLEFDFVFWPTEVSLIALADTSFATYESLFSNQTNPQTYSRSI